MNAFPVKSFWSSEKKLRSFVVFTLPCLFCWGIYFFAYYPGMMSQDSIDQWRPVVNFDFFDWHPALLSYLYWLLSLLWESPAIICIAQMLGLALVFTYGMVHLERFGLPKWALVLLTLFFCFFPLNGYYVNTLFKDVPFGIAILLAFIYLMIVVESKGYWLKSSGNLLQLAFTLGFIWVIRHNGILTSVAILGSLFWVYRPYRKRVGWLLVYTLAMVFMVKGVLYKIIGVHGRFYGVEMITTHQIAAVINSGAKLTEKEKKVIQQVLPLSVWQNKYNPFQVDELVFDKNFNYDHFDQPLAQKEYIATWFGIVTRNIPAVVKHQLKVTDLVWNMNLQSGSYNYAFHPLIDKNEFGIEMQSKLPSLKTFLTKANYFINHNRLLCALFFRPATYIYLSLAIFLLLFRFRSKQETLLLAMPILSILAGIVLTIPAQHVRYLYPVFLMTPFLAGYLLLALSKVSKVQDKKVLFTSLTNHA